MENSVDLVLLNWRTAGSHPGNAKRDSKQKDNYTTNMKKSF